MTHQRLLRLLAEQFGFSDFRSGQAAAIQSALNGRDVVVVMPTGSGKSLCFQLPAIELEGTTVVVSPLIALMKDQTEKLNARGLHAVSVNSSLGEKQLKAALQAIENGEVEFIYTTPERLQEPQFLSLLQRLSIDLFVVDEAHCISTWGQDFRPAYMELGAALKAIGRPPVLALTASATETVLGDIIRELGIPEAQVIETGYRRDNLFLEVKHFQTPTDKERAMHELAKRDGQGIVYVATTRAVDDLKAGLIAQGVSSVGYHGRMSARDRNSAQDVFMSGQAQVVVATNAFGLGIDKPDIRWITHFHVPTTLEAYYQEIGRSGRDGQPAACTLLYCPSDWKLLRFFRGNRFPDDSDLVNVYHAVQTACRNRGNPTTASLEAASPISKAKTRLCLKLLENAGVLRRRSSHWQLIVSDLSRERCEAIACAFVRKEEADRRCQEEMQAFAEGKRCRWRSIVEYFERSASSGDCGHCDRCGG
ncbi:RecQ family ATP-dependent DNA helicase [Planctomyces sp. SH-PL14]|uniref:RecQ family ATP-dependent DNA helicase n=1 Tax=Planctomyces sp. SH-PL14 TaxID=1632864 RepID=UPI00078CB62F|nr:RecQ family ATP-dependent DNA helicase [Planctomyces sp. SH-PL14]AMV19241.1 ATP-dependent DNA helicase RecQ [Planctomyces sp. SH-PL14]